MTTVLDTELSDRAKAFLVELVKLMIAVEVEVLVRVQEAPDPDGVLCHRFYIQVPERWIGYLVGPDQGSTANAIRRLLRAFVARHGCQAYVDARVQRRGLPEGLAATG